MILEILAVPSCVGPGFGTLFEVPDPVGWCFQGLPDALVVFHGSGLGFRAGSWTSGLSLNVFYDMDGCWSLEARMALPGCCLVLR